MKSKHNEALIFGDVILDLADSYRKKSGKFPDTTPWSTKPTENHSCCPSACLPTAWVGGGSWDDLRFEPANAYFGEYRWVNTTNSKTIQRGYLEMIFDADCDGNETHYMYVISTGHEGELLDSGTAKPTSLRKLTVMSDSQRELD